MSTDDEAGRELKDGLDALRWAYDDQVKVPKDAQKIWHDYWKKQYQTLVQEVRLPSLVQDGSLDSKNYCITLDTALSPLELELVLRHELMHAELGQRHYGEAIKRLESVAILMFGPLNILRSSIINDLYKRTFNSDVRTNSVVYSDRVARDATFRRLIRDRLAADELFMEGVRFLRNVELKRTLLEKNWTVVHEGAANWWPLINFMHKHQGEKEADQLYHQTFKRLATGQGAASEGFQKMFLLRSKWGAEWTFPAQITSVHPDITRFSLLAITLPQLEQELTTARLSPDIRLAEICKLAESGAFSPTDENFSQLYEKLDPGNSGALLTLKQFDEYWHTVDADASFVALMTALLKRLIDKPFRPIRSRPQKTPLDRGRYKVEHMYAISQVDAVLISVFKTLGIKPRFKFDKEKVRMFAKKKPIKILIRDKNGQILYDDEPSSIRVNQSEAISIFLGTMKSEGLVV
jgi:hypothetical protein